MSQSAHAMAGAAQKLRSPISEQDYRERYRYSIESPEAFWREEMQRLDWMRTPEKIINGHFGENHSRIKWFEDGVLNVSANCLDRHLERRGDKPAIIWEGDNPDHQRIITYRELHQQTGQFANMLKALGVGRGDTVTLYMPMIPEAAIAMLACARIGAVHSVVFGGFSPEALAGRISDCASRVVITSDISRRGGKQVPLKKNVDEALAIKGTDCVEHVLVVPCGEAPIDWQSRDIDACAMMKEQSATCDPEAMGAENPLFILYTSGSTGTPKGLMHTSGGYLLYAAMTHQQIFDLREDDVYWCAADVGWVTGHSYVVYGPLANGATTVMFEGVPSYPDYGRVGEVIDRHNITIFYTSPTAIRAMMRHGDHVMDSSRRDSLRLIGTVGEPINPQAWHFSHQIIGNGRCPIMDTWWQTETGGHMMAPLTDVDNVKPGATMRPFFGVRPALMDAEGQHIEGEGDGSLVIEGSWPGQARTIWGNHERFEETYFSTHPGTYFTGDGAHRDADGDYWITGRIDDVLNVSGHRMGTAEIESALVAHPAVAEAAVVGFPHDVKGQGIYAYITLMQGAESSEALATELNDVVRRDIGAIAKLDAIQWAPGLPKTRSGKIMRRILRKIAANEVDSLGDISTLSDPDVVEALIKERIQH
ncbi:acetyl-coenzyme A synthetase [Kushneria indalinina DSM 14324]|uniref:Acetate--CoA ligase n=2 Tax=Kushneria indalinina TaxID=184067 RepID=A0A3D9DZI7_9GAMM|nr:acetyl-coenzyme A synthetase [Kushneria indalinina DSM 14324]